MAADEAEDDEAEQDVLGDFRVDVGAWFTSLRSTPPHLDQLAAPLQEAVRRRLRVRSRPSTM
nr:hypothetical protein [Nonomuraea pusilla]